MHADGSTKRHPRGTDAEPNEPAVASGRTAECVAVDAESVAGHTGFGPDRRAL